MATLSVFNHREGRMKVGVTLQFLHALNFNNTELGGTIWRAKTEHLHYAPQI